MWVYTLSEIRIDRVFIPKVKKTKEGFLKGTATVTRTGVFKYKNLDGSDRFELRHPDEVLNSLSLETLKSIPITHEHPAQLVTVDNANLLTVGMTGETITVNDGEISTSIVITHKDGIEAINKGKQELSLGYTLDVIEEIGEYNGEKYTHRQSNIIYNHLAIVEQARAGRSARLNLDGVLYQCEIINESNNMEENTTHNDEKELNENNIAELAPVGEDHLNGEYTENNTTNITNSKLDRMDAIIDQLKIENAKLKSVNIDALVADGVKNRISLLRKAESIVNIDALIEKTDREIMEEVIKTQTTNIDLQEKSDSYILGRFDAIIDSFNNSRGIGKQMLNLIKNDSKEELSAIDILKNHSKRGA